MLLRVEGLHKSFGGIVATRNVNLDVEAGQTHAIIGPNGAGKTTLVTQITGELKADSGRVYLDGQDITALPVYTRARLGMARSFQITSIVGNLSVKENIMLAIQAHAGHSYKFWRNVHSDNSLTHPAQQMLEQVGLLNQANQLASGLSHGEHRQLEIAIAMANQPKLLLLDEPMAGMGGEESILMLELFKKIKGSTGILLIEHDMDVVFALADKISVMVDGAIIASDTPEAIRSSRDVEAAYLGEEA